MLAIAAGVVVLLLGGCPTAIPRGVGPVIILSIDRVQRSPSSCSRRTRPHVGDEVVERTPALANGDPSSSVVFERDSQRVVATIQHRRPHLILGRVSFPAVSVSKLNRCSVKAPSLDSVTTTRLLFRSTLAKNDRGDLFLGSARTSAQPSSFSHVAKNGQAPVYVVGEIKSLNHRWVDTDPPQTDQEITVKGHPL